MKELAALLTVERLARECSAQTEDVLHDVTALTVAAEHVDQDSVGEMQDFIDRVAELDIGEPFRELRLALIQLDLARAVEHERLNDPTFGVETK